MLVGILSDTHGKLPAEVSEAFEGVDHIIHAGDIGGRRILDELAAIAPVTAVRGNGDHDELEWRLNDTAVIALEGHKIMVFHEPKALRGPVHEGIEVVVNGHTHRSLVNRADGVLFVNPGSAGMRGRDGKGATVALLDLSGTLPEARIVELYA